MQETQPDESPDSEGAQETAIMGRKSACGKDPRT